MTACTARDGLARVRRTLRRRTLLLPPAASPHISVPLVHKLLRVRRLLSEGNSPPVCRTKPADSNVGSLPGGSEEKLPANARTEFYVASSELLFRAPPISARVQELARAVRRPAYLAQSKSFLS